MTKRLLLSSVAFAAAVTLPHLGAATQPLGMMKLTRGRDIAPNMAGNKTVGIAYANTRAMMLAVGMAAPPAISDLQVDPNSPPPPLASKFGPQAAVDDGLGSASPYLQSSSTHTDGEMIAEGDVVGAFRFICTPSHNRADDPIVYPGQPGKSHPHSFYGNDGARASSTYTSLRTTGHSSCVNDMNRTGYWIMALLRQDGKIVQPDFISIYYKQYPGGFGSYPASAYCTAGNALYVGRCVPIPNGIKFISGYDMLTHTTPTGSFTWRCYRAATDTGGPTYNNVVDAMNSCPALGGAASGWQLNFAVEAQACWNGVDLDSPNHRSHMSDMLYDPATSISRCPKTHPYLVPFFRLSTFYTLDATMDFTKTSSDWNAAIAAASTPAAKAAVAVNYVRLSSDMMPGMTPTLPGSTSHVDYFESWREAIKNTWWDNCIGRALNCAGGDLGDGTALKQDTVYHPYTLTVSPRLVTRPKMTIEATAIKLRKAS